MPRRRSLQALRRRARLSLESLESRRLLAIDGYLVAEEIDGTLWVNGSEQADFILIAPNQDDLDDELLVRIWDRHWTDPHAVLLFEEDFDYDDVNHIVVHTFGGDDHVNIGLMIPDTIYLGEGNDTAHGGFLTSHIHGEGGDDTLHGRQGDDFLFGGEGNDSLHGGDHRDHIYGDEGDDYIHGGAGPDQLHGLDGADTIHGGSGENEIYGGAGDDFLHGGAENDQIYGGSGNDFLFGEWGDDLLNGGPGDDELYGGRGSDTLLGGSGHDLLVAGYLNGNVPLLQAIREAWVAELRAQPVGYGSLSAFEERLHPVLGLNYGNWSTAQLDSYNSGGVELLESWLNQTSDVDYLDGGVGPDVFVGDGGVDYITSPYDGGWAFGAGGNDQMVLAGLRSTAVGGSGNDTIRAYSSYNAVYGGSGNDKLYGSDSTLGDYLFGEAGDDQLRGYGGADWLAGGSGNDQLFGGDGADYLHGGEGNDHLDGNGDFYGDGRRDAAIDHLWGGPGADTFSRYYGSHREVADIWHDFNSRDDREFYSTGRATGGEDWYFTKK